MLDPELEKILQDALVDSIKGLAKRVKKGEFSAADVAQLRGMAAAAGITLSFNGKRTPVGDAVLESLRDVDPDLLN